ncbi:MAG: acetyl-CoA carboxylase biotin carboxyl carrier protein subunit [Lutimonas sp.]
MKQPYLVSVNDSAKMEISQTELHQIHISSKDAHNYHLLDHHRAYHPQIIERDFYNRSYKIDLNGNLYHVKISSPLDEVIEKMGFESGTSKKTNLISTPMPGIIIDMKIAEGDEVEEGDTLFILEAMKMENAIISPKKARIKSVWAKNGDSVEKGKRIIELE